MEDTGEASEASELLSSNMSEDPYAMQAAAGDIGYDDDTGGESDEDPEDESRQWENFGGWLNGTFSLEEAIKRYVLYEGTAIENCSL